MPAVLSDLFDARALHRLRDTLLESPVIVELRFAGSPSAPERLVFDRYATFMDYLERLARPGDTIAVWRYDAECRPDNALVRSNAAA